MTFICPVVADAAAGHHVVHLGMTGFIVVVGSAMLVHGIVVFRRTAPAEPLVATGSQMPARRVFPLARWGPDRDSPGSRSRRTMIPDGPIVPSSRPAQGVHG